MSTSEVNMEKVSCTINGKTVEVKKGATIIEAYKELNEDIAHYCWHPGLTIAGVCRLCMVEVEGNPRVQIACNTPVQEGMVINNNSEKIKEAVKWGLDFHLINHPLDCPICDQAGECGLQDQYMKFGQYTPEMAEPKVKKRKVVDLGERVVLDSERCILCSRCVRFTEEVSKTNELGIFNRGDHSEVGTYKDKPLDNNYSINTVDICPVGALTSKDFRFQQRVWYLKEAETVCSGCSTGCKVKVSYNEEGLFRVKPVHSDVNGYWMCDKGREIYKHINRPARLMRATKNINGNVTTMSAGAAVKEVASQLTADSKIVFVLTGQYTNEEYAAVTTSYPNAQVIHWNSTEKQAAEFDGLLYRGDRNPNTAGLKKTVSSLKSLSDLDAAVSSADLVFVAGAESLTEEYSADYKDVLSKVSQAKNLVWLTCDKDEVYESGSYANAYFIPSLSYVEKKGTFTNYDGKDQCFNKVLSVVPGALSLSDAVSLLAGKDIVSDLTNDKGDLKTNFYTGQVEDPMTLHGSTQ